MDTRLPLHPAPAALFTALVALFLFCLSFVLVWLNADEPGLIAFATAVVILILRSLRGLSAVARRKFLPQLSRQTHLPVR